MQHWRWEKDGQGLAWLTFDKAGESANTFSRPALEELSKALNEINAQSPKGLVIRSEEPVDFHPLRKTSNVVCVKSLDDAMKWVTVATQTVGVYPFGRMAELRDKLASCGVQRVVRLGEAGPSAIGNPHDAMYPLHRFVHWMANEDGCGGGIVPRNPGPGLLTTAPQD